jgi:hypothetical protein
MHLDIVFRALPKVRHAWAEEIRKPKRGKKIATANEPKDPPNPNATATYYTKSHQEHHGGTRT